MCGDQFVARKRGPPITLAARDKYDLAFRFWFQSSRTAREFCGSSLAQKSMPGGNRAPVVHRDLIIALAARYGCRRSIMIRCFVAAGGLISYGSNNVEPCRLAAAPDAPLIQSRPIYRRQDSASIADTFSPRAGRTGIDLRQTVFPLELTRSRRGLTS